VRLKTVSFSNKSFKKVFYFMILFLYRMNLRGAGAKRMRETVGFSTPVGLNGVGQNHNVFSLDDEALMTGG
jgi:hypothetical protein